MTEAMLKTKMELQLTQSNEVDEQTEEEKNEKDKVNVQIQDVKLPDTEHKDRSANNPEIAVKYEKCLPCCGDCWCIKKKTRKILHESVCAVDIEGTLTMESYL